VKPSRGARGVLRGAALGLLGAALVAVVVAAAVWPLWYLATAHTTAYTILALGGLGAAAAWGVIMKARRKAAESPATRADS